MYLLDTNFLINYQINKSGFVEKFETLSHSRLFISVITSAEFLSGAKDSQINEFNKFLDMFIEIPITKNLARKAGIMRRELLKKGLKKKLPDILIAQTALENDLILVTSNPKDFPQLKGKGLMLEISE